MDILSHSVALLSIIVGLGLTEMFGNFHRLIRNRSRVTWDWLPVAWAAALLILVINYWWSIYLGVSGLDQAHNAAEFGLVLIPPILLFLTTATVLPQFEGGSDWNMRDYYGQQRRAFILTFALYQCSTWVLAFVIDAFAWDFTGIARAVILFVLASLLLLNRRACDWLGVAIILAVLVFRLTTQAVK